MRQVGSLIAVLFLLDAMAFATIFGSVRGIVHDPQHRPIQGAHVTLKAQNSDLTQSRTPTVTESSTSVLSPSEITR